MNTPHVLTRSLFQKPSLRISKTKSHPDDPLKSQQSRCALYLLGFLW